MMKSGNKVLARSLMSQVRTHVSSHYYVKTKWKAGTSNPLELEITRTWVVHLCGPDVFPSATRCSQHDSSDKP